MSEYTKTTWNSGAAPGIDADKLNKLETQYDCAKDDLDDHVGILTTRGDLPFRGSAGWARLAKGTAGKILTQGAEDPFWGAFIGSGSYEGDKTEDRAIAHGLGRTPKIIIFWVHDSSRDYNVIMLQDSASTCMGMRLDTAIVHTGFNIWDSTNFYVGPSSVTGGTGLNYTGYTYTWFAL